MNAVQEMKNLLYEELELITRTTSNLIAKIQPEDWDYRPAANMRTLRELVQHLTAIPSVDLLILQEKKEAPVREQEKVFYSETDKDKLTAGMSNGLEDLKHYMNGLTDDDFLNRKTRPFYLDHGTVQAKWLIEIVTHAQHHRAQMFNYLKALGYEVNMFDLY